MRVLGIDPGSNATGFGVVERQAGRLVWLAHGTLRAPRGATLAQRLATLHDGLAEAISMHRPDVAAVERVFVASNPHAALILGQARGAALVAVAAAGLPVVEYAATEIKRAIATTGRARKAQVQRMVARLLELSSAPQTDAADALAAAICHANAGPLAGLGTTARRGGRRRVRSLPRARVAP
ncbi:MAG: crossover junction endodeoxyribonuclease RuvC [Deltaproteobacteria bacterium]|nr:MAG: crossover junction endodeoxyribonuclease RuvC [Deltaproteobacteria bacterium]